MIGFVRYHDNLIVIRTLSKAFGLAGFRLGYCVANADIINAVSLTKPSYNLNSFTQLMGVVALEHSEEILKHNVPPTIAVRDYLIEKLKTIKGVEVFPSAANFILVRTCDGPRYVKALSEADICVRSYGNRADLANCLRITATTEYVANKILKVFQKEASHGKVCALSLNTVEDVQKLGTMLRPYVIPTADDVEQRLLAVVPPAADKEAVFASLSQAMNS